MCVGRGMYFLRAWGCIVCRFGDVFCEGWGGVLCAGVGMYSVRVWDVLCVMLGKVLREGLGVSCV